MNADAPANGAGGQAPARILVIDDEVIIHSSLRKILGNQGHQVDAVSNAPDGLERLNAESYDLVISDLMMPQMNGIELLKELRKQSIKVPVLMITGYPTIHTAVQALRLGAVDYLAKPFRRQELLGPVSRALRRSREEVPAPAPSIPSSIPGAPTAPDGEGIQQPKVDVRPGDTFYLREHSWALARQDGTMDVGIEDSFLRAAGPGASIETPASGDLVEQGYIGFRLTTVHNELHAVFMPLSGQVVDVNQDAVGHPEALDAKKWIARIIPNNLETELPLLKRRKPAP